MQKNKTKLVVIIPVGPTTSPTFLLDTINSVEFYCASNHKIILVNDSQKEITYIAKEKNIKIIDTDRSMGKQSGLYYSLCMGMRWAVEHYDFDVLLRMDDDALITGPDPEVDAISYFNSNQDVGMLGSYRQTWEYAPRSFVPPRNEIIIETSIFWKLLRFFKLKTSNDISPIVKQAKKNGYQLGEHVLGGVYFMSYELVSKLYSSNFLPSRNFLGSHLEEDHIFGILTFAVGMKLADFVTNDFPMCLKWRGMPTSPKNILKMGKKVIHSTRYYHELDESGVRAVFKKARR